jgi:hypothetical protein
MTLSQTYAWDKAQNPEGRRAVPHSENEARQADGFCPAALILWACATAAECTETKRLLRNWKTSCRFWHNAISKIPDFVQICEADLQI